MNHSNFTVFPALHFPTSYCSWTNSHPCAFQKPQAGDGATIAQRPQVGGTSDHMCRIILTLCCLALCSLVVNRCPALLPGAKSLPSHRSLIKIKLLCFKTRVHCWKSWSLVCNDRLSAAAAAAKSLQSCLTLCDPIDGSHQAPPSLGFSRQEHWSGLPFPSPMHESEK